MHRFLSTLDGSFMSMAPTGHFTAHRPHFTHFRVAFGTMPTLPDSLYGLLPGICGAVSSPLSIFSRIRNANSFSRLLSSTSGRPAAYLRTMECSAMAATAATTLKPAFCAISCSSVSVSSYARLPYTHSSMARAPLACIAARRSAAGCGTRPPYEGTAMTATSL